MTNERHEGLEQGRQLGRLRAERLDLTLRAEEQREREMRLVRLAGDADLAHGPDPSDPADLAGPAGGDELGPAASADLSEVWRLRQEVERLTAFHQAVVRSRAWRLLQWARRPFGRAW